MKRLSLALACVLAWGNAVAASPVSHAAHASSKHGAKTVVLADGLRYVDDVVGKGAEAKDGQNVRVHYTGTLTSGLKFDSSRDRNEPFEFTLGAHRVIAGWDEGVKGMRVGGRRKLTIPAALGYGAQGAGEKIPPNATLLFDIELLGLK